MPRHYGWVILQYCPDLRQDERFTIGVLVWEKPRTGVVRLVRVAILTPAVDRARARGRVCTTPLTVSRVEMTRALEQHVARRVAQSARLTESELVSACAILNYQTDTALCTGNVGTYTLTTEEEAAVAIWHCAMDLLSNLVVTLFAEEDPPCLSSSIAP